MKKCAINLCCVVVAIVSVAVSPLVSDSSCAQSVESPSDNGKSHVEATRGLQVDDMFRLENLGTPYSFGPPSGFAPNGEAVAFIRARPRVETSFDQWLRYRQAAVEDVWVQLAKDTAPMNITEGAKDGSGWCSLQWSPDSSKLAIMSTRDNGVYLWLWDVEQRKLRKISQERVFVKDGEQPFVWIDSHRLLYTALPKDLTAEGSSLSEEPRTTMDIAPLEWGKYRRGEGTASVLNSGVPSEIRSGRRGELRLLDLNGTDRTIADNVDNEDWQPSPNGHFTYLFHSKPANRGESLVWQIELVALDGRKIVMPEMPADILTDSVQWSADGTQLAFLGYPKVNDRKNASLYRFDLNRQHIVVLPLLNLRVDTLVYNEWRGDHLKWTAAGDLILVAARAEDADKSVKTGIKPRRNWWRIAGDGKIISLTDGMKEVPPRLWPLEGRGAYFGLAEGALWKITPASGKIENLTQKFPQEISRLSWPTDRGTKARTAQDRTYERVIFESVVKERTADWQLDFVTGGIMPIHAPSKNAGVFSFSPESGSVLLSENDRNGLFLWRMEAGAEKAATLVATNLWLQKIGEAQFRMIEYTSETGEKLQAGLLLPYDYRPGRKYPLISVVYLGDVIVSRYGPTFLGVSVVGGKFGNDTTENLQFATSRGYAVLFPSMPLKPCCAADDPYLRLTNGVLPAIDRVVELGFADPDRLFVMGHSFGGFSTFGLITQTNRFKSAAEIDGPADFISGFGTFNGEARYTSYPHEWHQRMEMEFEHGQTRMAAAPWQDPERYMRNSPLLYVQRVETPLLLIHGDMDFLPMTQAEEFFTALNHDGKRGQFVRYWGEPHMPENPANIRDMWRRVFAWFDEFGDIQRDVTGNVVFDGDHVRSRNGAPPLKPDDFIVFGQKAAQEAAREAPATTK